MKDVVLVNVFGRATKHRYLRSEVADGAVPTIGGKTVRGLAHYYECSETGFSRIYGFDRLTDDEENVHDD